MSSSATLCIPTTASPPIATVHLLISVVIFIAVVTVLLTPGGLAWAFTKPRSKPTIPGPSGVPILGLLFVFTSNLTHRTLAKLSTAFNATPLMAFSVGFTRFVISSEPETAKEILNSSGFADRPVKESAYELLFHRAMGFAPYGEYWRNLRRISAIHLFSSKRVSDFGGFRGELGLQLVNQVAFSMNRDGVVEVKKLLHFASLNNIMMTVFGRSYDDFSGGVVEELVSEGYELLGIFNWSDHFPIISMFDLQGVRRRCRGLVSRVNVFVTGIIDEHRERRSSHGGVNGDHGGDFVDVLLDLQSENKFSESDMIAVLWEMIFRGTDTVAILLEWILARMVLHPEIQARAQSEIDGVVGARSGSGRSVCDTDLPNLPYLHAIVKETLRVHPPGPLLSWARLAIHDTQVGPHVVPAGTTAMVNMWAIAHDKRIWADPKRFDPERFMGQEVSVMGSDLRLAPFGAGRRVCPGKAMGLATVELWLAQLLQKFKWVGSGSGQVDLSECLKMSLEMKKPLVCKAVARV